MSSQKLFGVFVPIFTTVTLLVGCGNRDQEIDLSVTASPNGQGGSLSSPTQIQLAASESGAEIYYTLDGNEPNKESIRYQSPIEITSNTVLKFVGFYTYEITKKKFGGIVKEKKDQQAVSEVVTETYSFNSGVLPTPQQTPTNQPVASSTPALVAPTASEITLSGTPQVTSMTTSIAISVSGSTFGVYKFALVSQAVGCGTAVFSASWIATSQAIQESLGADGNYKLCVIAKGTNGIEMTSSAAKEYLWTKDTVAPTGSDITLTGLPPTINNVSSINITVGGAGIVSYKYSKMNNQSTLCQNATYNSSWTSISTPITEAVNFDGQHRLCVVAKDSAGNEQWPTDNNAKQHDWTRDTAPPTATISNVPSGSSSATTLNVTVAGSQVVDYKFAITSGQCHTATNYSTSWIPVATHITDTLGADGFYRLCVIGRKASLAEQTIDNASVASWTKVP